MNGRPDLEKAVPKLPVLAKAAALVLVVSSKECSYPKRMQGTLLITKKTRLTEILTLM